MSSLSSVYFDSSRESEVVTGGRIQDYTKFNPRGYISEYYSSLGVENRFLMEFYHEVYKKVSPEASLLEFGGGPTVYQLFSAGQKVREIVFAEYLECNRQEVFKWVKGDPDAVNWNEFLDYVLKLNNKAPTRENRDHISETVKPKITRILECDAFMPDMIAGMKPRMFDIVSSGFCLECITPSEKAFRSFMEKICRFLAPGGMLVMTMLKNSRFYHVGDMAFPSFPVDERYMKALLGILGFGKIDVRSVAAELDQGYEGLIALTASR